MMMPGRTAGTAEYIWSRMGFNGQAKDDEVYGKGNYIEFAARGYDPRIGRFTAVDPLAGEFPWNSTYAFAENDIIRCRDLEGLEKAPSITQQRDNTSAKVSVGTANSTFAQAQQMSRNAALSRAYTTWVENEQNANLEDAVFGDNIIHRRQYEHQSPPDGVIEQPMDFHDRIKAGFNMAGPAFLTSAPQNVTNGLIQEQPVGKGMNNPVVKNAANLGNKVHYDQLNGGTGKALPTELSARYPETEFTFTRRGQAGADVKVTGGTHPSQYPGSTWNPGNMFGDFKPNTPSGIKTFNRDVKVGKLPSNTEIIPYSSKTGNLK